MSVKLYRGKVTDAHLHLILTGTAYALLSQAQSALIDANEVSPVSVQTLQEAIDSVKSWELAMRPSAGDDA
jgi:hypothetical protein